MDKIEFQKLATEGYNRIPVWRSVLADLDTPLSVYLKLADGGDTFLFESVEGGETWGRYSIIGLPAARRYQFSGNEFSIFHHGQQVSVETVSDPLEKVAQLQAAVKAPMLKELPVFAGGLVGFFGYENVGNIEARLRTENKPDQLNTPEILLLESNELAVFDSLAGRLFLIVNADPAQADAWETTQRRLDQLAYRLRAGSPAYPEAAPASELDESQIKYSISKDEFIKGVKRCKEYIMAGDVFQVVLSQRMSVPLKARPLDVYRALRALNPSPYMYFLDLGDSVDKAARTQIVGSSPEVLVRVQNGEMLLRPIAGTRPRGQDALEDQRLEAELLADPKERAEHLMLIDLARNDLGRVCQTGSVKVTEQMLVERYSHVMHIVSQVEGKLRPELGVVDAIRAAFPAGTLSGAPKIRAMEIINELEPVKRNIYAGAVGYINWLGDTDLAIAIRTAIIKDGVLHVQAGAGLVADSDPESEWQETLSKGRALINAVNNAAAGL
ncbi:MAG: anthranilate synthase component I [Xanthomonadales bacterium]|nr:anthranilate synthase component I [Xanthomonadales bacterium]